MHTTNSLIEAIREKYRCNYSEVARKLGIETATISSARRLGTVFKDEQAIRAAELLGLPAPAVVIDIQMERVKKDPLLSKVWGTIRDAANDALKTALCAFIVVGLLVLHVPPAPAANDPAPGQTQFNINEVIDSEENYMQREERIYTMRQNRRTLRQRLRETLRRVWRWLFPPILVFALAGCGTVARAADWVPLTIPSWDMLQADYAGPYEFIAKNLNAGPFGMTEIRALNNLSDGTGAGCAVDVGTTGSNYNDPGNGGLIAGTGFVVFESGCHTPFIKNNNTREPMKIGSPKYPITITPEGLALLPPSRSCPSAMTSPGICADGSGQLWKYTGGVTTAGSASRL